MNPFVITVRDRWNRPIRRLDHTALAIAVMASAIGAGLITFHPYLVGGAKLAHRLVASF